MQVAPDPGGSVSDSEPGADVKMLFARLHALEQALQDKSTLDPTLARRKSRAPPVPESPHAATNFHQATTYFSFARGIPVATQCAFQLSSTLLVWLQLVVVAAAVLGCSAPVCSGHHQCPGPRVCLPNRFWYRGLGKSCVNCGGDAKKFALQKYLQFEGDPEFSCPLDDDVCRFCYDQEARRFNDFDINEQVRANFGAMQWKDWLAVVLTSGVLGLSIANEIQEITLCELHRARMIEDAKSIGGISRLQRVWIWLDCLNGKPFPPCCLRRYGIMSGLAAASHELIAYRGGDALSVCLNTVALIFIIECDDLLYENAVGDAMKAREEEGEADAGLAAIDEAAAGFLAWTKFAHFSVVTVGLVVAVGGVGLDVLPRTVGTFASALTMGLVGLVESQTLTRTRLAGGRVLALMSAVVSILVGLGIMIALIYLS